MLMAKQEETIYLMNVGTTGYKKSQSSLFGGWWTTKQDPRSCDMLKNMSKVCDSPSKKNITHDIVYYLLSDDQ